MNTPRQRVEDEAHRRGREVLVRQMARALGGGEVDVDLVVALGGEHGANVVAGRDGGLEGYWPRVWAARGLLHVWGDDATAALVGAARDPSWRVREMAAKVVARHRVEAAFDAMVALRDDDVARVRRSAERALAALSAAGR